MANTSLTNRFRRQRGDLARGPGEQLPTKAAEPAAVALTHAGQGWTWLSLDAKGKLEILNTRNNESPLTTDSRPILAVDLWDHAYRLLFQNRRQAWIKSWWNIVNWDEASRLYSRILSGMPLDQIYPS